MVRPGTHQLMDPCGGLRQLLVPLIACLVEQVHVPGRFSWFTQTLGDYLPDLPFRIVEVHDTWVGNDLSGLYRRASVIGREHLGPDYARGNEGAGKFLKDDLLHRTGAA